MKELQTINYDNQYVQAAVEINEICKANKCDVAQAVARYNAAHDLPNGTDEQKEFLHLVNEKLMTGNADGMTLEKLAAKVQE